MVNNSITAGLNETDKYIAPIAQDSSDSQWPLGMVMVNHDTRLFPTDLAHATLFGQHPVKRFRRHTVPS